MRDKPKNQPAVLVSFSGIDGAGKSSQIAGLCAGLREAGLRVELLTFWDDAARLKRIREGAGHMLFRGDKGVGTPEAPIHRRDKNIRSPLMTLVRAALYLVDAVSLRKAAKRALRSNADVVIFDRYIYDELANLNLRNPAARLYIRGIATLVPRPRIGFVLDADPAQAHARKPEYPLEFLRSNRNSYLRLSELLGDMTVIPPMPREKAKAEVARHAARHLFFHNSRGGNTDHPLPQEISGAETELDGRSARPIVF